MGLHIGDTAPDFTAETSTGKIGFHDWIGQSWVFFFSHPGDFTPVCTTEIGRTAQLAAEFQKRNVKPLGLSTDDTQHTTVMFPIVADPDSRIAKLYDMIHDQQSSTQAVRSVFIIDPDRKIRLTLTYPMNVGRNFDEILRVIDALQLGSVDNHLDAMSAATRFQHAA